VQEEAARWERRAMRMEEQVEELMGRDHELRCKPCSVDLHLNPDHHFGLVPTYFSDGITKMNHPLVARRNHGAKDEALEQMPVPVLNFLVASSALNHRAKEKVLRERLAAAEEAREKAQAETRRVRTEVEGEAELRDEAAKRRYSLV